MGFKLNPLGPPFDLVGSAGATVTGFAVEYRTVSALEDGDQKLTLAASPSVVTETRLTFPCGTMQVYGLDFDVINGNELNWGGLSLETLITTGDTLVIEYFV